MSTVQTIRKESNGDYEGTGDWKFLIMQVVHKEISHTKRTKFIIGSERQVERLCCKVFEPTQVSPLSEYALFFSQMRKISSSIRW